ncbi:hypothetical protein CHUAL_009820 [Chamberlinius hualienensis]
MDLLTNFEIGPPTGTIEGKKPTPVLHRTPPFPEPINTIREPSTYEEATLSLERDHWKDAIQKELTMFDERQVWDIVPH